MLYVMEEIFNSFNRKNVDYITFVTSLVVVIGIAFFILYNAEQTAILIEGYKDSVISIFGPIYLLLTPVCFIFMLYLAFSKYGRYIIELWHDDDEDGFFNLNDWLLNEGLVKEADY